MTEPKLWPAQGHVVACSGLRLRQVASVGVRTFCYRVFRRQTGRRVRWLLTRTEVESPNRLVAKGEPVDLGPGGRGFSSFGEASGAIFDDAHKLARFDAGEQLPLERDDSLDDFESDGAA
jgi:hypothetical protein